MYLKIKKLCNKQGISVNELENKLHFSRGSICKWDKSIPNVNKVKLVADFFQVSIDYLLSEKDEEGAADE